MALPKPQCWIVDVDGTLALLGKRNPFSWRGVGQDKPNSPVIEIVRALAQSPASPAIVLVSGRMEKARTLTQKWLERHQVPYERLYMRENQNFEPDEDLKRRIFQRVIFPHFEVVGVLDDRDKVVAMWRSLGLTCLQVAPGDF